VSGRLLVAIVAVVTLAGVARADDPKWSQGVSDERKQHAKALLDAGNALFVDNNYPDALAKYKEAIASWDHPAIRFNIVRCLVQLERPIEAWDNLVLALQFGAEPLEPNVYKEALGYRKLLANQIGELEVTCDQPGAKLVVDSTALATCPAREVRRVLPGPHVIVGSLAGYLTASQTVVVVGGSHEVARISLVRLSDAARVTHRWPSWIPWLLTASGAAIAGVGGLVEIKARSDQNLYERSVARDCTMTACTPDAVVAGLHDSAISENRLGIATISLGLAAVVAGGVMVYLNRGHLDYDAASHILSIHGAL
jgi:hypothetical protein